MEEKTMGVGERLIKVLSAPTEAFTAIGQDPRPLIPALLFIIISLGLGLVISPEVQEYTREMLAATGANPDQIAVALKWILPGTIAGIILGMPIIWLVQGLVLFLYNQFAGGEASFKQLFSVSIFAGLPGMIGSIIKNILVKILGYKAVLQVNTSLALLLGTADPNSFMFRLLGQFDFFSIWSLILLILGGAIVMKKPSRGLGICVILLWLVFVFATAFAGGLSQTGTVS